MLFPTDKKPQHRTVGVNYLWAQYAANAVTVSDVETQGVVGAGSARGCAEQKQATAATSSSSSPSSSASSSPSSSSADSSEEMSEGEHVDEQGDEQGDEQEDGEEGEGEEEGVEDSGDDVQPVDGPRKKRYRPVLDQRPQFDILFPEHLIPADPITVHNFVHTESPETYKCLPQNLRSDRWLEDHYDILKGERALLYDQINFMEQQTHTALAQASLASYEAAQEKRLMGAIFDRIEASAGKHFAKYLRRLIKSGAGDPEEESEISVHEEDEEDEGEGGRGDRQEMPLFGDAYYEEEEIPEELLAYVYSMH